MEKEYDSIYNLAKKHGFKKIIVKKRTWNNYSYATIFEISFEFNVMTIYAEVNTKNYAIYKELPHTFDFELLQVLEEPIKLTN